MSLSSISRLTSPHCPLREAVVPNWTLREAVREPVTVAALLRRAGPNILQRYGPSTALGLGAAGLFGAFEPGEEPEPVDFYDQMYGPNSALGRLQSNPGLFSVGIPSPAYTPATLDDIRYSAMGGPINQNNFPPRIGAINGPGTGTSDDIPAMLTANM